MSDIFEQAQTTEDPDAALDRVQTLLVRLRHLIQTVEKGQRLLDGREVIDDLMNVHRALTVMDLLHERYVIAVAGPQGAGKTTTVKCLYDLPDGYLPINAITGEKLPVVLVEHEGDGYQAYTYRYDVDNSSVERHPVDRETCHETASSPGADDLMVEIEVPARFFGAPGQGFVLLPGVEQGNSFHVELAKRVLPTAATALMCVDSTLLARKNVDDEVRRVREGMQVGDTKLLYAITKPQSRAKAESTVETLRDRFDIDDPRQVVVVRSSQEENSWQDSLYDAVSQYGNVPRERRKAEHDALRQTLYDLEDHFSTIRKELDLAAAKTRKKEREEIEPILKRFDKHVESHREDLDSVLEDKLEQYCGPAVEEVRRKIQDEGKLDKVKNLFKSGSLKERIDFQKLVEKSWKNAHPAGPEVVVLDALNHSVQKLLPRETSLPQLFTNGEQSESKPGNTANRTDQMVGTLTLAGEHEPSVVDTDAGALQDVRFLMTNPEQSITPTDNLKQNIRAVPALALETVRLAFISESLKDVRVRPSENGGPENDVSVPDALREEVQDARGSGLEILKGVGIMAGLDVLPDAELDVLKGLVSAAGGEASMAYLGPTVAALVAAYGTVAVVKTVRRQDIHRSDAAEAAFDRIANRVRFRVLSAYDDYMERVRDRMEQVLCSRLNVDLDFADAYNVNSKLAKAETSVRGVKDVIPVRV